jgi:hypothetical protein
LNFDPTRIELAPETQQVLEFAVDEAVASVITTSAPNTFCSGWCAWIHWMEALRRLGVTAGSDPPPDPPRVE